MDARTRYLTAAGLCGVLGCMGPSSSALGRARPDLSPAQRDHLATTGLLDTPLTPPAKAVTVPVPLQPATAAPTVVRSQAADPPGEQNIAARIIARVDDQPILERELRDAMHPQLFSLYQLPETERDAKLKEIRQAELMKLVERELLIRELMKLKKQRPSMVQTLEREASREADRRLAGIKAANKIASDEDFQKVLENSRMSLRGLRQAIERQFLATEFMKGFIGPTVQGGTALSAVRDYYDAHPDEFANEDKVRWLDLYIDAAAHGGKPQALAFAQSIAPRASSEADFVNLVKQFDAGDARFREGVGLGEKRGEIRPPAVEETIFRLKPNEMTLVEFPSGYHLVRVTSRQVAGRKPFDETTQAEVRRKLQGLVAEREYRKLIDDLKRKTAIVIHEE